MKSILDVLFEEAAAVREYNQYSSASQHFSSVGCDTVANECQQKAEAAESRIYSLREELKTLLLS